MASNFLKYKWQRVTLYTLAGIIAAILLLALFVNVYFKPMLQEKLKSSIAESSDSLYRVSFTDAEISVLQGKIVIDSAVLSVDSAVYHRKKKNGTAPNNLYDLRVNQIRLYGVHPFKLYFSKKVDVDKIVLSRPHIDMSYEINSTEDKPSDDERTIWQRVSKSLKSIRVGQILLNDLRFRHIDYSGEKALRTEIREMNLNATDLFIDSTTQGDTSRFFYCRDIVTEINNYSGKTPDGLYIYYLEHIKLSTRTQQLILSGITFKPFNTLLFFNKTTSDRFNITLDTLKLNHFNFINYYKYRAVSASSVNIGKGKFSVFGAPNKVPNYKVDKVKSFPHVALRNLKFGIKVDTINIEEIDMLYSEYNKKSKQSGTITFSNTTGQILNLTNNKKALQKNNLCRVKFISDFMNQGRLNVSFVLNLTAKDAAFSYKGSLGPMELSRLNRGIMAISMVKVTSGNLKRFSFDVNANRYAARGNMTMLYDDLKINILKRDDDDGKLKKKGLMSLMANHLIIERNNPDDPGKKPRRANITFKRPINYPFFKLAWKTLFAGVKECAGVSEMDEKKANAKMSESDLKKQRGEKE